MTRAEFATHLGVPESTVALWGGKGGLLHDRPRGYYSEIDAAVCRAYLELQRVMGDRSPRALEAAKQLAPHVVAAVRAGRTEPIRVTLTAGDGRPVEVAVDVAILTEPATA